VQTNEIVRWRFCDRAVRIDRVWLVVAPWLWERLGRGAGVIRQAWGTRIAGGLLAAVAVQAVWMDLSRQIRIWCG